jgi:hypothetical protein
MEDDSNEFIVCRGGKCYLSSPTPLEQRRLIGRGSLRDAIEEELLRQALG